MNEDEKLNIGLFKLGFSESTIQDVAEKLAAYAHELETANPAYGLSAIHGYDEIIVRHILDSLAAYPELTRLKDEIIHERTALNGKEVFDSSKEADPVLIADIGSGGGIPGIPLAILMSATNFVLIERMAKRCAFLEQCVAKLQLKNVKIENVEMERIPQNSFDIAVFRAFRPLDKKMSHFLLRTLKSNGKLVAYKAKTEKITEEMTAIAEWVPTYHLVKLEVPFLEDHARHLVIIPK